MRQLKDILVCTLSGTTDRAY